MNQPESKSIRLLIVDDHKVVRLGLHTLLSRHNGIEVVGEAGTSAAAVEQTSRLKPEVVAIINYDAASAIKITIPRPTISGDIDDNDVFGGQQYGPLVDLEIP